MIRLRRDDFENPHELATLAATAGLSLQEFRSEFEYLIGAEPPHLVIDPGTQMLVEATAARTLQRHESHAPSRQPHR